MRVLPAVVVLAVALTAAAPSAADPVDDYVRAQLGPRKIPGLSIAVVRNGAIVKAAGYGVASLELSAPATADTVYEIGSISKQFAADAVLLLVEDGTVALDDPINNYLDAPPAAWAAITVRHVLEHTAGLADFDTGDIGFSYRRDYTNREFVELLARQPLQFPPGTNWNYTNAFPLLGMVVERASGQSYADFVTARIFRRLSLASARFKRNGEVVPQRADGYLLKDGAHVHGEMLRPMVIAANGGVMMNVRDFAAWDIAMTSGRLLKPQSVAAIATPARLADGRRVGHGLGWFLDTFNGHEFGAHWGTTVTGHSAVIRRYVQDRVTVIVLANVDEGGGFAVDAISKHVANLYVPGTAIQGMTPRPDPDAAETARLKTALQTVGEGRPSAQAPGLAERLPAPVRARIATALRDARAFEFLGDERVGPHVFVANPAIVRLRRYRATQAGTSRYFTLQLAADGALLGAIVEE